MPKPSAHQAVLTPEITTHSGLGKEGIHVGPAIRKEPMSDEIIYKYLIDLRLDLRDKSKYFPPISQFPPPVKAYLRLLGRTEAVQAIAHELDPDRIAKAELAGGWRVIRLGRYPPSGQAPRGCFLDEARITPQAIAKCPTMPWLYNAHRSDIAKQMQGNTELHDIDWTTLSGPSDSLKYAKRSSYVAAAYTVMISNVIVPLPDISFDENDPRYPELIRQCYSDGHPLLKLDNEWNINYNNDERLFMYERDAAIDRDFLLDPDDTRGLNKDRDEAYEYYLDNIYGNLV